MQSWVLNNEKGSFPRSLEGSLAAAPRDVATLLSSYREVADASTRATSSAPPCQSWSFSLRHSGVARTVTVAPHRHRRTVAPSHRRFSGAGLPRPGDEAPSHRRRRHRRAVAPSHRRISGNGLPRPGDEANLQIREPLNLFAPSRHRTVASVVMDYLVQAMTRIFRSMNR